jgi:integrase
MATIRFRPNRSGSGRWYLDNGEGPWIPCTSDLTSTGTPLYTLKEEKPLVQKWRDEVVAEMTKQGITSTVPVVAAETVSKWFGRYYDAAEKGTVGRKNRGKPQAASDDRRARFKSWIEEVIGHMPMVSVTKADLRKVVARLDGEIRTRNAFYALESTEPRKGNKPGISAKTAAHVWSEVTSGFREASGSKDASLLVREDDPSYKVLAPTTGEEREQAALYPAELLALLTCARIPVTRRRTYAVCAYTGLRRSEAERLRVEDVDLTHDTIRVRGKKTDAAQRSIPIEATLRPLLAKILAEHEADRKNRVAQGGHVPTVLLDVPRADGRNGAADLMKKDLVRAELKRADLWLDDDRHMPFVFHGLRHTAITHWVVAGRSELFLLTAGGHSDITMTKRYLAKGASVSAKFGQPHPPLPAEIIGQGLPIPQVTALVTEGPDSVRKALKRSRVVVGPAGLERASSSGFA